MSVVAVPTAPCVVSVVITAISRVTSDNRAVSSRNGGVRTGVEGTPICVDTGVRHRLGSPGDCSVVVVGVGVYFDSPATRRTSGIAGPHPNIPALLETGPVQVWRRLSA